MKPPSGIPESVQEQRARPFTSAAHCLIDRRLDGDQAGCSAGDCTCACPDCCAARRRLSETIEPLRLDSRVLPAQPDPRSDPADRRFEAYGAAQDRRSTMEVRFKVAGAETGAVVEEAMRSRRPPPPRVMTGDKPRNRGAGLLPSPESLVIPSDARPDEPPAARRRPLTADQPRISVSEFEPDETYKARIRSYYKPGQPPDPRADPADRRFAGYAAAQRPGLFANVDFKTGPVPDLAHPGELVIGLGRADEHGLSEVVVALSDPSGFYVLDRGRFTVDGRRDVVLQAKLPERPAATFETLDGPKTAAEVAAQVGGSTAPTEAHGIPGHGGRISLVNAPKWEAVAARARKAGIEPDWALTGALWLALDKFESSEVRRRDAELACRKAVAKEARTGTKLGEARKAIESSTVWLREQVADIDPDLPVAELDEAQLRGVVGVELLRLRRELAEAQARADRAAREVEAGNFRHGELVAERAALRKDIEVARRVNKGMTDALRLELSEAQAERDALSSDLDARRPGQRPACAAPNAPGPAPLIVDWARRHNAAKAPDESPPGSTIEVTGGPETLGALGVKAPVVVEVRAYHPETRETSFARCPWGSTTPADIIIVAPTNDRDSLCEAAVALYQRRSGDSRRPFVMTGFVGGPPDVQQSVIMNPDDPEAERRHAWVGVGGVTITRVVKGGS